ncbi:MAG TPA: GatB/YqeY domain-containing protein [Egibacteraceae bacterium]|nr:GatB/YqeY domain-containing protein [Egibacteraceae bacterium]
MALSEQIQADLTAAMKARDAETVGTLRMVVAAIKNARVAAGQSGDVTDEQVLELLTREAKKRTEAAEAYDEAGRTELAEKERRELEVIRAYLPEQLDEATLQQVVDEAIAETGATSPSDLGRVMSAVMPKVKGRADGKAVNAMVRQRLTG